MTTQTPRRFFIGSVLVFGLVVGGAPWSPSQVASAQDQTLYVGFTDLEGAPVTDMTPEEVLISWDEEYCEIVELEPINWPVRVTVFVDNATESQSALPDMREGLNLFLDALPPEIEVAIGTIGGRPQFQLGHTTDRTELTNAVGGIASAGGAATFFDALYEEAERLDDDDDREYLPVIVMVAIAGAEGSSQARGSNLQKTMDLLYENAAVVHTLLLPTPVGGVGSNVGIRQGTWATDFAAATRGRNMPMGSAIDFRSALPELAADLARKHKLVSNQYKVTYKPPRNASDQPRVQMGSRRKGVTVLPTDNGNIP